MSVAFVREESAESAQEVTLPARPISAHPNLVTQSGLHALEQAVAKGRAAVKAAQLIEDMNERRRAIELAARDLQYFSERVASEDEADPRLGMISYVSPLARRLIGKRVGDFVDMDGHEIQLVAID